MKFSNLLFEADNTGAYGGYTQGNNNSRKDIYTGLIKDLIKTINEKILDKFGQNGEGITEDNFDYMRRMYKKELTTWFSQHYADIKSAASTLADLTGAGVFRRIRNIPVFAQKSSAAISAPFSKSEGFWALHDNIPASLGMIGEQEVAKQYKQAILQMGNIMAGAYDKYGNTENFIKAPTMLEFPEFKDPSKLYYSTDNDVIYKVENDKYVPATEEDVAKFQEDGVYDEFIEKISDPEYFEKRRNSGLIKRDQINTINQTSKSFATDILPALKDAVNVIFNTPIYSDKTLLTTPTAKLELFAQLTRLSESDQQLLLSSINNKPTPQSKFHEIKQFLSKRDYTVANTDQNFNTVHNKILQQYKDDKADSKSYIWADQKYNLLLSLLQQVPFSTTTNEISKFMDKLNSLGYAQQNIFRNIDPSLKPTEIMRILSSEVDKRQQNQNISAVSANNPLTLLSKFEKTERSVLDKFLRAVNKEILPTESKLRFLNKLLTLPVEKRMKIMDIINNSPETVIQLITSGKL